MLHAMPNEQNRLSFRERWQVLGIASGFLLVLGLLTWIAVTYVAPAAIIDEISEKFRAGRIRSAMGLCVTLVFYVVGLPLGLVLSLLSLFQGGSGKRTRLTNWLLREMSDQKVRERHEHTIRSLNAEGELSQTDKVLNRYLPQTVGWAILLAMLVVVLAVLAWAATRD
jgi:hypothetical protein